MGSLISCLLLGLWIAAELSERKKLKMPPSSVGEFLAYSRKASSPDPRYPPLYFSGVCYLCFTLWEGLVRTMLGLQPSNAILISASIMILAAIFWRYRRFQHQHLDCEFNWKDFVLLFGGIALLNGYLLPLIFAPWFLYRAWPFIRPPKTVN